MVAKRGNAQASGENSDEASGNGRASKRVRLAAVDPDEEEAEEDDEINGEDSESDSDDDGEYAVAPDKGLATLQSEVRAAASEDRRQERELASARRRAQSQPNGPGASGIIKRVYLENFMCHERLSFDFGENMNFVIGHNGSGKSAVLTAITIVLGGKTSSTGRGSGFADLIRSGIPKAVVRIVLKNTGRSPYRAHEWGDEITIERVLVRVGASSWRIRSSLSGERSKPLSTKKETITAMMDHFDIQVDNPMTVLTQDMSRAFLTTSDAHKKYELFLKGTQLQKLINDYNALEVKTNQVETNLERQKAGLKELSAASQKWKKMYDHMRSIRAQDELIIETQKDTAWAYVRDKALEVKKLQEASDVAHAELDLAQKRLDDFAGNSAEADVKIADAAKAHKDFQDSNGSVATELAKAVAKYKEIKTVEGEQRRAIADLSTSLIAKERMMTELEQKREDEIQRTGRVGFAEKQQALRDSKTESEEKLAKVQKQLEPQRVKVESAKQSYDAAQAALKKCKVDKQQLEEGVSRATGHLAAAQREQSGGGQNKLNRYGQKLQAVWAEIDKVHWDGGKPIGPLGVHVKVKPGEEQYIKVIESAMGINLVAWAVRTAGDRAKLMKIFKTCQNNHGTTFDVGKNDRHAIPPILTHAGELFDYARGDLSHQHKTVLSVLEIDDQQVIRLLINAASIERIFVSPSRSKADETARGMRGQQAIFWTADMFRVNTTPSGGQSSSPLYPWNGSSMLSTDLQAEIRTRSAAVEHAKAQIQEVDAEFRTLEADRNRSSELSTEAERGLSQLRKWQQELRTKIQQLESDLIDEQPVSVSTFTDEIERIRQARAMDDEQFIALTAQLKETLAEAEALKVQREELKGRRDNYAQQLSELAETVSEAKASKDGLLKGQKNLATIRAKKAETANAKLADLQAGETGLEAWREKAAGFCPEERHPTASVNELTQKMRTAERTRDKGNANFKHSLEVVTQNVNESAAKYAQAKTIVREASAAIQRLHSTVNQRKRHWTTLRSEITKWTRDGFSDYLQVRGFTGSLEIDHTLSTLDMKVATEISQSGHLATREKDTRALSGGETSFTTLCLILAIWYNVQSPLRCLDEFDVFMDAENRKLAMSLLVRVATGVDVSAGKALSNGGANILGKRGDERQYILITPQEMSGAKLPPTVKVLRMRDPERGQTRLTGTSA